MDSAETTYKHAHGLAVALITPLDHKRRLKPGAIPMNLMSWLLTSGPINKTTRCADLFGSGNAAGPWSCVVELDMVVPRTSSLGNGYESPLV